MFSANNFYQWTLETYLKSKNHCMITYHPFGSRGYKNLQIWNMHTSTDTLLIQDTHASQVLMNDQEPLYIDVMINWKKEQHLVTPKTPYIGHNTLNMMYTKTEKLQHMFNQDFLSKFTEQDHAQYQHRASTVKDPVAYYNDRLDDISWVARMLFTGIRAPVIVHSELRSPVIEQLTKEFIPVYVFWHGLVARDWYRHWRHNKQCMPNKSRAHTNKRFLLYARDYTGSRSYREHFVKQLITNHLASAFQYQNYPDEACLREHFPVTKTDNYYEHNFVHDVFNQQSHTINLKSQVSVSAQSSASIHVDDYNSTAIQVVAETIFENQRIHLTEKTFQPMVAGQPFVTLSSPGTLEILKYYGFQTFDHVWDESYDMIKDPAERMSAVIDVIKYLNTHDKFESIYEKCLPICEHNRNHFFSTRFESQMLSEYDHNWRSAYELQNDIADIDPGGSTFWFMNENLTKLNFELTDWDKKYIAWLLKNIEIYSKEQHQGILKQYPWCYDL